MKPVYTLSGRDLSMIKYNDFINKKALSMIKYNDFINKKAPELCGFRGFPPCKM